MVLVPLYKGVFGAYPETRSLKLTRRFPRLITAILRACRTYHRLQYLRKV